MHGNYGTIVVVYGCAWSDPGANWTGGGEYRRLGLFMTSPGDSMNLLGVPHRSEEGIPCMEYDPVTHEHVIVIV